MTSAGQFLIRDPSTLPLDRRRKAAIVVQHLLAEGAPPPISDLPEDAQVALTREMGSLPLVDRATLDHVLEEFTEALERVGLAPPTGEDEALRVLSAHISPSAAARVRAEAAERRGLDPWAAVAALPRPALADALSRESVEVAAVALSRLPVQTAAEVLGLLPGPAAQRITLAMPRTSGVSPATVARIGRALAEEHCGRPSPAFAGDAGERLGAILNASAPATRHSVLGGLDAEDGTFAAEVRRAIFTFAHLPRRVRAGDVPRVLRGVDGATAALALAHAGRTGGEEAAAAEFVLASLPQRLADGLREEMETLDRIRPADGEAAQAAIVAAVRDRVAAGEVRLVEEEDDDAQG